MERCSRCILPDDYPNLNFDDRGVCNICKDYDNKWANWRQKNNLDSKARELERIFAAAKRRKRRYDVLVPLSGGKDSTYALYICKKIYNLNVLALNLDNGFQSEHARQNIQNAVNKLGVDLVAYKPNWELMKGLYRLFLRKTGMFCPPCLRAIYASIIRFAQIFDVPLIISGCSSRTDERAPKEMFQDGDIRFFKNVVRGEMNFNELGELLFEKPFLPMRRIIAKNKLFNEIFYKIDSIFQKGIFIKLPDYIDWDYAKIRKIIQTELGWNDGAGRWEHFDCIMDPVKDYLRRRKWENITTNTLKYSALIRNDQMSRQEAMTKIKAEEAQNDAPEILQTFLKHLDLTEADIENAVSNKFKHLKFR